MKAQLLPACCVLVMPALTLGACQKGAAGVSLCDVTVMSALPLEASYEGVARALSLWRGFHGIFVLAALDNYSDDS